MPRQKVILRPFWRSCAIGLAISALMVTLYVGDPKGLTSWFEAFSLDLRFKYANHQVKPSDDIRIVAIDDQTLRQVEPEYGRFPWPRRAFGDLVGVLAEADARQIALDLHFPEAQRVVSLPAGAATPLAVEPAIQDDEVFAAAIRRAGNVYLPIVGLAMPGRYDMAEIQRIGRTIGREDAALGDAEYSRRVGLPLPLLGSDASLRSRLASRLRERFWLNDQQVAEAVKADIQAVRDCIGTVRQQVALELVAAHLKTDPQASTESLCRALLRGAPAGVRVNPAEVAWALEQTRTAQVIQPNLPVLSPQDLRPIPQLRGTFLVEMPVLPLAEAACGFGHVVFDRDPDGSVRRVPALVRWGNRVVPQMGVRVATDLLRLRWERARVTAERIAVPGTTLDGHDHIYTLYLDPAGQMLVNWTHGGDDWSTCFAPVPAGAVLEVAQLRHQIQRNEDDLRLARLRMVQLIQPSELDRFRQLLDQEQQVQRQLQKVPPASQRKPVERSLQDQLEQIRMQYKTTAQACIDMLEMIAPDLPAAIEQSRDAAERQDLQERLALFHEIARGELARQIADFNAGLVGRIEQRLARLRQCLAGKTVFVGCTAVALADIVSTPIWKQSPGVMTHAQVLNAMLQDRSIQPLAEPTNVAIVLACCVAMTIVAAWLGPQASLAAMLAACAAFTGLSGAVLFERMGVATALATPLAGMFLTWAMITAYRQLVEERAKRHMTRTLQQYTSPALARRMAEDPEAIARAENREVTCFFSDLKGFTGISEQLGAEATQHVLNTYLERMTEALDGRQALVNKFLGDGIFAFFNPAINPQPDHAERACAATLEAMAALDRLKREPGGAACQPLRMRIGLASGMAVVGNCGSERKFDYTCIGDTVNLASRLEGANKTFGTGILINGRCRQLAGDAWVCRYIGRVIVTGRTAHEDVYELVGRIGQVAAGHLERIARFEQAVRCYIAGSLAGAKAGFEECVQADNDDAAARFYADLCERQMQVPLPAGWTGAVEMVGK